MTPPLYEMTIAQLRDALDAAAAESELGDDTVVILALTDGNRNVRGAELVGDDFVITQSPT